MAVSRFKWKHFLGRLYERSIDADLLGHSAQVAFYFSFALFPLLYFLVSLFGLILVSSDDMRYELLSYLRQIMPWTVFDLVRRTINEITVSSTGTKAFIGLVAALWAASAVDLTALLAETVAHNAIDAPTTRHVRTFACLKSNCLSAISHGGFDSL